MIRIDSKKFLGIPYTKTGKDDVDGSPRFSRREAFSDKCLLWGEVPDGRSSNGLKWISRRTGHQVGVLARFIHKEMEREGEGEEPTETLAEFLNDRMPPTRPIQRWLDTLPSRAIQELVPQIPGIPYWVTRLVDGGFTAITGPVTPHFDPEEVLWKMFQWDLNYGPDRVRAQYALQPVRGRWDQEAEYTALTSTLSSPTIRMLKAWGCVPQRLSKK